MHSHKVPKTSTGSKVIWQLTSRLHHLVKLGLNMKLGVFCLDTLQLNGNLLTSLQVGPYQEKYT